MNTDLLLWAILIFVIVCAIALTMQAVSLFLIYQVTKTIVGKVDGVMPKVNGILATAQSTLEQSKTHIVDITAKANNIMDSAKTQLEKLEVVLDDATGRAKAQFDRAELVIDDTVSRVHETVGVVHNGIMKPLREVSGVANGVRTAVSHLMRGNRPNQVPITQDEEMFI